MTRNEQTRRYLREYFKMRAIDVPWIEAIVDDGLANRPFAYSWFHPRIAIHLLGGLAGPL